MPGNEFPLRGTSPAWFATLDAASQAEWRSLNRESDPELYQEGLLHFAGRQEQKHRESVAGAIYSAILGGDDAPSSIAYARARQRLAVLNGGGAAGARAEYLLGHMTQELSDPAMIAAMGTAGAVFRLTRLAALTRLSAAAPAWLTRGWTARGLASTAAYALEAPTFTLAHRLGRAALGQTQDWSRGALTRDFASSYLILGAMKVGGAASRGLQGFGGHRSAAANALFQQSGMLGGILISQGIERRLGWRPAVAGDAALADALMTWLQFNAAGRLSQEILGSRFARWERSVDAQAAALERSPSNPPLPPLFQRGLRNILPTLPSPELVSASGPRLAQILPGTRPEIAGPSQVHMSETKFGRGSPGPTRLREAEPATQAAPAKDPRQEFFRVRVSRQVRSQMGGDGERTFQYELILEDFESFLKPGADRAIATRDGGEVRLKLVNQDMTENGHLFLPSGIRGYTFEISEGPTKGEWHIYVNREGIMSFNLITENMRPGVGGLVLDWMATQAAAQNRQAHFLAVHNLGVFEIIQKRGLIQESSTLIEAQEWTRRHSRKSTPIGRFGDKDFLWRNRGGYFNIWSNPRPELLPPELRSANIPRVPENNKRPVYDLQITPLRQFLSPGFEATIAKRQERELRVHVKESVLTGSDDRFMPAGTPRLAMEFSLGEQRGGKIDLYIEPHRLTLANLERGPLPPGIGSIALDWIYTQAAARGASVDLLNIRNPYIWNILLEERLFDADSARVELGHWDWMLGEFQPQSSAAYREIDPFRHYRPGESLLIPVANLRSRPNLERIASDPAGASLIGRNF